MFDLSGLIKFFWEPFSTKEGFRDCWNTILTGFILLAILMVGTLLLSALAQAVIKAIGSSTSLVIGILGIIVVTIYLNWPAEKKK